MPTDAIYLANYAAQCLRRHSAIPSPMGTMLQDTRPSCRRPALNSRSAWVFFAVSCTGSHLAQARPCSGQHVDGAGHISEENTQSSPLGQPRAHTTGRCLPQSPRRASPAAAAAQSSAGRSACQHLRIEGASFPAGLRRVLRMSAPPTVCMTWKGSSALAVRLPNKGPYR